ncbi:esterase FE4-like isoform X1 [Onthophagus taurus]|uniref:esterase FE4-like isoform X1 n=1 Tax=Onthophagus taurus TaxID=166361 RepID=UPI0039BE0982
MAKIKIILLFSLCYASTSLGYFKQSETNLIVSTPLGQLRGTTLTSRKGEKILSFLGVRYAEAPIGNLRFQPPVPVKPWNEIYDATENPPLCPQSFVDSTKEDCLFLNVYTRSLENEKKPVMVFFHPGGFYEGISSSEFFGPHYILDQDIVLVVPNYRLQTLGFLATGSKEAPGNNGLKDQVQVLRWVQQNIASFSGDPNNVTICGYSAGGMSVTLHMVSPMSRGLFHKAISMSGTAFGVQPIISDQLRLAKKQAQLVNCPEEVDNGLIDCLKSKTSEELSNNLEGYQEFLYDPIWLWMPVIEPDFGQERFLVEHPIKSVVNKRVADVPLLIGVTKDEFGGRSYFVVNNQTALKEFDENYKTIWPIIFGYERDSQFSLNVSEGLRKFYFPGNEIDESKRQGIADLYADSIIGFGSNRGAKLLTQHLNSKVYYYQFSYEGEHSFFYIPGTNDTIPYGASHHDDLFYLFYISLRTPMFTEEPESKIVDNLTTIWGNFIKTGNPNAELYNWPEYDLINQQYLDININLKTSSFMFEERYESEDVITKVTARITKRMGLK